jgi:hypothetical protein
MRESTRQSKPAGMRFSKTDQHLLIRAILGPDKPLYWQRLFGKPNKTPILALLFAAMIAIIRQLTSRV